MPAPDSYMPFSGNEFFQAVEGQPDDISVGYMRALWHYWNHNHCDGLRNDPETLRRICRIERDRWLDVQPIIFGELFKLDANELWQQKRAQEEWKLASDKYQAVTERAIIAAKARWKRRR